MSLPKPDRKEGWIDAGWRLPRPEAMPVEVQFVDGKTAIREKVDGSWLKIAYWRLASRKPRNTR